MFVPRWRDLIPAPRPQRSAHTAPGKPRAGPAAGAPCFAAGSAAAHLHQVWGHEAPAAHHVQQRPRLAPHDPQHGVPEAEQVEGAFSVLGGLNFSYKKARA